MRACFTCCEIISTSCAKGCASTPKSRLNDLARCEIPGQRRGCSDWNASFSGLCRLAAPLRIRPHAKCKGERLLHCGVAIRPMSALGHWWTAPDLQELF